MRAAKLLVRQGIALPGKKKRTRFIMRKQTCTMIATVILLGGLSVSANAQCGHDTLKAQIPFQFAAGNTMLPAGEYVIKCIDPNREQLVIQKTDEKAIAIVPVIVVSGRPQENASLVFDRIGNRYFLVQAWAGGSNCLELPPTHAEAAARELAGIKAKPETVGLMARR